MNSDVKIVAINLKNWYFLHSLRKMMLYVPGVVRKMQKNCCPYLVPVLPAVQVQALAHLVEVQDLHELKYNN